MYMKTKIKKFKQFNVHLTAEDEAIIKKLREEHGVSISSIFKVFLRNLEQQLSKIDYKSGIK